jgi:translocation and assembly module TamB
MSDDKLDDRFEDKLISPAAGVSATNGPAAQGPVKRHRWLRALGWTAGSLLALIVVLVLGATYYTTTNDFQRRVGGELVNVLEDSVGGRVEIGHVSFSLWHLAIEVDGLVIHGTEPAGQMPYLSAEKIFVRVRVNTFLSHTVGKGAQSHIGLNYLAVEQPHFHLIIDKDGKTNQPTPRKASAPSTEPIQSTLLDLQAGKVELTNGLAVINDRAAPFNIAAENLDVQVHYLASTDRYGATVDLANLRTQMGAYPEVQSKLHIAAEFGRDMAQLTSLQFATGDKITLKASGLIDHFAKPEWQADATGSIDLKQLGYLARFDGFYAGYADLDLHGRNCVVTPQAAQKNPHFWQRHNKAPMMPETKLLPPDPDCKAGYLLVGGVHAHKVTYRIPNVHVHDVDAGADLRVTPTELLFTALTSTLPGGGTIGGELKIENWLGEVPASAPAQTAVAVATTANTAAKGLGAKAPINLKPEPVPSHAHAYLTVKLKGISLRTIMDITEPEHHGDLGLDTSIAGPVTVEWGGAVTNIADSVQVQANLDLTPSGVPGRGYLANIPVRGKIIGHYDGRTEVVNIEALNVTTPQTTLTTSGVLGVSSGDPLTDLKVNLQAHDLGEFDQILQTLGFQNDGKKGSAALPVVLHGTLGFNGTARGAVANLDVKGHLEANDLEVKLGTMTDVHIDAVVADAEYSPRNGVAVGSSTIKRGTAVLNLAGTFAPRRVVSRRGVVDYVWDKGGAVNATVKLANAQVVDVLQIAGMQEKVPVTGTINVNAHAQGPADNLAGSGNVTLTNGVAYGEGFQTLSADLNVVGQQVNATKLLIMAHGMSVTGSGGYNMANEHIQAQLEGDNLVLSKFDTVKKADPDADGVLSFQATASGTVKEPNLHAKLNLTNLTVQGKPVGELHATADSSGSDVSYNVNSLLVGAQVGIVGKTSLLGDFQTQAKLTVTGLDISKPMDLFAPGTTGSTIKATSVINGTMTVEGPAAKPMLLTGNAEFSDLDVKAQGVEFKTAQPLRASLKSGVVTIDQLHIVGQDTDLHAGGTIGVFGDNNPNGGKLGLTANGNISLAIVHTLDPDLITSGEVNFQVAADGRLKNPSLTGKVEFKNVNAAVDGIPNGLSDLNGTMVFNENRLDVQNITAQTGGGLLKIGGSISYQKGIYANLTATGDNVRVRLYGLSATANAQFQLQGGPQSILLSGNVLVTRFGVGPDVDFAAFSGAGGVQAPPDPDAATNKIRLDVHITSSPQLDFQNSYAKLAGNVDLRVTGTVAQPSVLGKIQITDGSATFAGTNYELERGTVYFSNPVRIDPTIDLDATARVENYDITIGLHGTSTSLKPTYRSEPPLTEADIFNLLALGRTQEEAQLYQEQQVQAGTDPTTSALLGGALNATVSSRVGKLFGAGSVKIDPAFVGTLGNSSARITVQEPIGKQLMLTFATNVNQTAEQLIQLQYQINQDTALVATRDESGVFSIVYKVRKRYR